jgi:hypothetical protein
MPPTARFVCSFSAEPPQEPAPYGAWADRLREHFLGACLRAEGGEAAGDDVGWYPDRTWSGRTYIPATVPSEGGGEWFGFVSFVPGPGESEPTDFDARAEFTDETAERNPGWQMDLSDEIVGSWRGEQGSAAQMTLVWGRPMIPGGAVVTAELADLAVDQCALVEGRFTLLAPDNYRGDTLDCKLFDKRGSKIAQESLYEDDLDAGEG